MDEVDLVDIEEEELKRIDTLAELEAAKMRTIFDQEALKVDYRRLRATDAKHNTRLVLTGPLTSAQEQELVMCRVEW